MIKTKQEAIEAKQMLSCFGHFIEYNHSWIKYIPENRLFDLKGHSLSDEEIRRLKNDCKSKT